MAPVVLFVTAKTLCERPVAFVMNVFFFLFNQFKFVHVGSKSSILLRFKVVTDFKVRVTSSRCVLHRSLFRPKQSQDFYFFSVCTKKDIISHKPPPASSSAEHRSVLIVFS